MQSFLRFLLRDLFRVTLTGASPVRRGDEAYLFLCNHRSPLDALLAGLLLPGHPIVIVPPEDVQGRLVRWLLRFVPHVVLDIATAAALKPLLKLLREGRSVALFPEGRTIRSAAVTKVYPVPALAALRSAAACVPVFLHYPAAASSPVRIGRKLLGATLQMMAGKRISCADAGSARQRRVHATRQLTAMMQDAALAGHAAKPLFECFLDACRAHGRDAPIVEDLKQGVQTYGAMLRGGLALGRLFRRFTADRECVGVLLPNVPATIQTVLGLSGARRVPVMFNYSGGVAAIRTARQAAGVKTVITSRRFIEQARLEALIENLKECTIVYLEDLRSRFGVMDKLWLIAYALRFPRRTLASQSASDPAVVLFTSGSDGEPKGVVLSHQAIIANVTQIRTVIEFTPEDKILNPLPLYHAYSFTAGMVLPLTTGTRLHLYISPLHYRAIPEIAYRHDCTVLFGTSTFLSYYAAYANPADFSRIRYVISGGEKLSPEVTRVWLEKFGLRIFEGYGCTECAPVISLATPSAHRSETVGRFLPGMEYCIASVPGIDRGGILHLRGPNLMLGHYLKEAPGVVQPCRSELGAGWYDTGDVVEMDEDGFVLIHGRMRRFAKIAGEMVSLDHVEHVARTASPGHFHAAVLAVAEYGGETTVLFTTDPALDRITLQRTARILGSRDLAVAREIVKVRELPMLRTGKTDYTGLAQMAQSRRLGPRERAASSPAAARPEQRVAAAQTTGTN
jgi:acyl-[acyl-carrier-protein]-phospholipid O-acyltransferase/long-chain-fatty-acid--[acyl-carrier-protein] ligase